MQNDTENRMSGINLTAGVLKAATAILTSRVLGFVREILTAAFFGAGVLTDAFFLAWKIPNIFRRVLGEGALEKVFIPYLGEGLGEDFKRSVFGYLLILASITVVVLEISAPFVVDLLSHSGNGLFLEKATLFLRILALYLLFAFINAYFSSLLLSKGAFFKPYLSQAIFNFTVIGFILLFHQVWGIYSLVIGAVAGGILQVLYIVLVAKSEGVAVLPSFRFHPILVKFFRDMLPSFASGGIGQLATLVEAFFATAVGGGVLSTLYYAFRLYQLPVSLVGVAVSRVSLSDLSSVKRRENGSNTAGGSEDSLTERRLKKAVEIGLFFAVPLFLALFFLSGSIVNAVYTRGAFTLEDATSTALFLKLYALGLPFAVSQSVLSNYYFVQKRFLTLFLLTLPWFLSELVLGGVGIFVFNFGGWIIPLAYSIGAMVTFFTVCISAELCSLVGKAFLELKRFVPLWIITAAVLIALERFLNGWTAIFCSAPLGVLYLYLFKKTYKGN